MGLISVYSEAEEALLFKLFKEFASKVQYDRGQEKTQVTKSYEKDLGIFGVVDVLVAEDKSEAIYEVKFPKQYVEFFKYLLAKSR